MSHELWNMRLDSAHFNEPLMRSKSCRFQIYCNSVSRFSAIRSFILLSHPNSLIIRRTFIASKSFNQCLHYLRFQGRTLRNRFHSCICLLEPDDLNILNEFGYISREGEEENHGCHANECAEMQDREFDKV